MRTYGVHGKTRGGCPSGGEQRVTQLFSFHCRRPSHRMSTGYPSRGWRTLECERSFSRPEGEVMSVPRRACTIVAREALTRARVMIASLEKHHPDVEIVTLITDGSEGDRSRSGLGEILLPGDLLPDREWADMAAIYDAAELAGALKPYLLARLVAHGGSAVYLSPDTVVYGDLGLVYEAAERRGIALTPQLLDPMPRDGRYPDAVSYTHLRAHETDSYLVC